MPGSIESRCEGRPGVSRERTWAIWLRRGLTAASWLCALALGIDWLLLRLVGERWWLAAALLYLPHGILLGPVLVLAVGVALLGPRRLLLLLGAATWVLLFPIMGLELAGPRSPTPGAARLRVLSFNVDSGDRSLSAVVAEIQALGPDVVMLQESNAAVEAAVAAALPGYFLRASTQFLVASRFAIVDFLEPPRLPVAGVLRSPRFVQATLDTPLGRMQVIDLHPVSPGEALDDLRGNGVLVGLRDGSIWSRDGSGVSRNAALRQAQVRAAARLAVAVPGPVVIAGDTNLTGASRILAEALGDWAEAHATAGLGFGYTFPANRRFAWMRIDRILAGPGLRILDTGTGRGRGSDHRCVWADLEVVAKGSAP